MKKEDLIDNGPEYYHKTSIQPIELMKELMTPEQFKGFLWGNILKYAMRYGSKEDKITTAEKIVNYAQWLKEEEEYDAP